MKQACRAIRFVFLAFGIAAASWAPMVPVLKNRLSLDHFQFGLLLSLAGAGAILTLPLSSWLINRIGSYRVVVLSGLAFAGLLPLLTIPSAFVSLCIMFFLFSWANNGLNVAINTQAVAAESSSNQSLMSGFHCSFSVGSLLGIALMGWLLNQGLDLFYCASIVSLFSAGIMAFQWKDLFSGELSTKSPEPSRGGVGMGVLLLGLLCFVAFIGEGAMLHWGAEFLSSSFQYPTSQAGIGYGLFSLAMAAGRFFGDRMIARFGQRVVFQWSCLLEAVGFFILFVPLWGRAELAGFFLVGLGAANVIPILFSLTGRSPGIAPYYALAVVTFFGYTGGLIGPFLTGLVANTYSLGVAFGCTGAILFATGFFGFPAVLRSSE